MPALPLDIRGTSFQFAVWEQLRAIPPGQTRSYSEIARLIGRPRAVRAVGTANGANPVSVLIPCHRAMRASGHPGGYRWGLERKRLLLEMEARRREEPNP
jgi:AraC family transcriptional regulator of adaptative response/methylated-DNA-[protein]-cysteine methyltransferase